MIETFFISERFFTPDELKSFRYFHGYDIKDISYSAYQEEDFSVSHQKEFLLKEGFPKILSRFFF